MATIGRVLLISKGNYEANVIYNKLDWVRYNGSAWVCKKDLTKGITPEENDNWTLLASDGAVSGEINWSKVINKPFNGVSEEDFTVDEDGNLRSNTPDITWDNVKEKPFSSIKSFTGTLSAGETTISLGTEIDEDSQIIPFTSVFGINPKDMSVSDGICELTFDAMESNIFVKILVLKED